MAPLGDAGPRRLPRYERGSRGPGMTSCNVENTNGSQVSVWRGDSLVQLRARPVIQHDNLPR